MGYCPIQVWHWVMLKLDLTVKRSFQDVGEVDVRRFGQQRLAGSRAALATGRSKPWITACPPWIGRGLSIGLNWCTHKETPIWCTHKETPIDCLAPTAGALLP
jgi:hypothetical protein